jgi:hypothetical protein
MKKNEVLRVALENKLLASLACQKKLHVLIKFNGEFIHIFK